MYNLFISVKDPLTFDMCRKLDSFLAPQMTKLASDISDGYSKKALALRYGWALGGNWEYVLLIILDCERVSSQMNVLSVSDRPNLK